MNASQQRVLFSFRRVIAFVDARPNLTTTPEFPAIATHIAGLKDLVERASTTAADQHTFANSAKRAATDQPALRGTLLDHHLRTIVKVARGLDGTVPGIGVLRTPRSNSRDAALIDEASGFADHAAVYAPVLIEHGLSEDFVARLRSAIAALRTSITIRGVARNKLRRATRSIEEDLASGRRIVMMLDGLISHHLVGDAPQRTEWKAAKRIELRPGPGRGSGLRDEKGSVVAQQPSSTDQRTSSTDQRAA